MAHNAYSEETRSASTEKMLLGAGLKRLSGFELRNKIKVILQKDDNISPPQIPHLTDRLCSIIGDYTFEVTNMLAKADPDFGQLEPESSQRRAVLVELLSVGQYHGFELYEPINMELDSLHVRTETYQRLYSAARMAFCSDLNYVQRVAYAARSFPFFSALKRLLLKPHKPGQTYYEYICMFSGKEPSRKIKNAAKTGNYQFGNEEAVMLLDKLVLHETGKKNVFRKWEENGWLPVDIQSDTVFACAYAFSLPLFSRTEDDIGITANYLFEHVEASVTDVLNAEQDILRFGLRAGIRYQEAAALTDAYTAYFNAREAKAPSSARSTVNAAIEQFFQGQNRDSSAFFELLASHGVKPVIKAHSGRGRIQREDAHLKADLLDLRTRAVQRYMQDIFNLTSAVDPETLLVYCCEKAIPTLKELKTDGSLDEVSVMLKQYFDPKEKHGLMNGEQLFSFFANAYRFDMPDKAADAIMDTAPDRLTARLLWFLSDGKKVLQDQKYCRSVLTEEKILKMYRGEALPEKRGVDRDMILRLAYLYTVVSELRCRINGQAVPDRIFERFRDTADQWLDECLFLQYKPSFVTDAVFYQVFQDEQKLFRPLIYQIFLPRQL